MVGRTAAIAEAQGADSGLAHLKAIKADAIMSYQPNWALAAYLFMRLQRYEDARTAYSRAIGLCSGPSVREFLTAQAQAME